MGWEMRNEEPPNKEVHAEDLAQALSKLHARSNYVEPPSPVDMDVNDEQNIKMLAGTRNRSGTGTIVYHPQDHGHSPDLPAISVEDTTGNDDISPVVEEKPIMAHTARPPVELMEQ